MYLGIDLGTSALKAVAAGRRRPHRRAAERAAGGVAPASAVERAVARRLVARAGASRSASSRARTPARCARCARSGCRGRCTAPCCSTPPARCCAPRSCGTTAAASRSAPSSPSACRACAQIAGNLAMPGFTAPKLLWVREHEPQIFAQHRQGAAAQGLAALQAERRVLHRLLRRVGHAVAGRRRARLVGRTARGLRADARADAGARRGQRAGGPAEGRRRRALRPAGRHRHRRRRRRQRRQRRGHGRHRAGRRLRVAGHLGRDLPVQRPLPARARVGRARVLPRAARRAGTR